MRVIACQELSLQLLRSCGTWNPGLPSHEARQSRGILWTVAIKIRSADVKTGAPDTYKISDGYWSFGVAEGECEDNTLPLRPEEERFTVILWKSV